MLQNKELKQLVEELHKEQQKELQILLVVLTSVGK
jgi:hypothetical protein